MDLKRYKIDIINKPECSEFLRKYHYLSKQGFSFRSGYNFGLFYDDILIGVCIFHTVSAWETIKGCFGLQNKEQTGFWELGRLAMDIEHKEKNSLSWFVSHSIKLLRKLTDVRAIISYADSDFHHGYIYQATNFKYYGLTTPKKDFWVKLPNGEYKKQSRGKTKGVEGEWRKRSQKHRYLLVFDKTLRVLWKEKKYPKGNNAAY